MPRGSLLIAVLMLAGLAVLGGFYMLSRPGPEPEAAAPPAEPATGAIDGDQPGPYMAITMAGQAEGRIVIDLFEQTAPGHVAQITALANEGKYDGVVFHRVIKGFMAQTGDVEFGLAGGDLAQVGMGGSDRPDLAAEFSDIPFARGIVGMARSSDPDSANSQFFIMFDQGDFLNGQYTVIGKVTEGLDVLDAIKLGEGPNGAVIGEPDRMQSVVITE